MRLILFILGIGLIGLYVVSPIDLLPLNPLDDAVVVVAGLSLLFKGFGMEKEAEEISRRN